MPSAIFIYLSAPQPPPSVCQPGPAEPPSPSGHTSLLLTPVTTCPSLASRRSSPALAIRLPHKHNDQRAVPFLTDMLVRAHVCLKFAPQRCWTGVSCPKPRAQVVLHLLSDSTPCVSGLGKTSLPSKSSMSRGPGPLGGMPTLQRLPSQSPWGDERHQVREQASSSRACAPLPAGRLAAR